MNWLLFYKCKVGGKSATEEVAVVHGQLSHDLWLHCVTLLYDYDLTFFMESMRQTRWRLTWLEVNIVAHRLLQLQSKGSFGP